MKTMLTTLLGSSLLFFACAAEAQYYNYGDSYDYDPNWGAYEYQRNWYSGSGQYRTGFGSSTDVRFRENDSVQDPYGMDDYVDPYDFGYYGRTYGSPARAGTFVGYDYDVEDEDFEDWYDYNPDYGMYDYGYDAIPEPWDGTVWNREWEFQY